jgi:formylglycine-generating enzyme required for sulfatase activity
MPDVPLRELHRRWEEARQGGLLPSAEQLCHDCPELIEQVRELLGVWAAPSATNSASWGVPLDASRAQAPPTAGPAPHAPPQPPVALQPGAEPVPGYRLVAFLGKGSFGEVWRAEGPGGVPLALKFIPLQAASAEVRSLELMKQLRHPHLLALSGAWQHAGALIVATELADGTLADRLRQCLAQGLPGIPPGELLEHLQEAAKGLDYLNEPRHALGGRTNVGIQHRDVKPANLLLVGGSVKVGDFGLAKLIEETQPGHTLAFTLAYAAPELFDGVIAHQSDQYSLAVTYCQLRGGRLPFTGTLAQLTAAHLRQAPDLSMLPEAERAVVARALAKDPQQRWPSCRAFVQALAQVAGGQPGTASAGPAVGPLGASTVLAPPTDPRPLGKAGDTMPQPGGPSTARGQGARGRAPWVAGAVGLVAVALVVLVVWLLSAGSGPHAPGGKQGPLNPGAPPKEVVNPGPLLKEVVKPGALPKEVVNSLGMKFVLVPAGKFMMGSPRSEPEHRDEERPQHEVELTQPFYLGAYEVTQNQYQEVMGKNPSRWQTAPRGGPDFAVENVRWEDAVEFCKRLSALPQERAKGRVYALPTEAQWEYACRGGPAATGDAFHYGKTLSSREANFNGEHPYWKSDPGPYRAGPTKVGSFKPNALGLYDMHGNLWEWCHDWYDPDYYQRSPRKDPRGPASSPVNGHVLRGGSWNDPGAHCRCGYRYVNPPNFGEGLHGFRALLRVGPRAAKEP